jgi:hypothetical protein
MLGISESHKKLGIGLALLLGAGAVTVLVGFFPTASNQGYAPEQPIPFSHKIHSGDNKIACQYCHSQVERSKHATIPSMNVCMNCHTVVKPDSPHIQKLKAAFAEGKAVEWIRVHELPDYVYFPHKRHVAAGVSCETCHGDVKSMDRVFQHSSLTMGWCMECHRGETAPKNVMAKFYPGMKNPHGPVAPVNCNTCHH